VPGRSCGSGALLDEIAIGDRAEIDSDPEQPIEGTVQVASAVPAEDELVEIATDVALPQSVEGALRPSLEVREHAVDPVKEFVRLPPLDDACLVGVRRWVLVAEPAVRDDVRARLTQVSTLHDTGLLGVAATGEKDSDGLDLAKGTVR
jgi:hypothetical protein